MMSQIPPTSDPVWNRLVSGQITHKFGLFAANMAVWRAVQAAAKDPTQKPTLIEELYRFSCKYAEVMSGELQSLR